MQSCSGFPPSRPQAPFLRSLPSSPPAPSLAPFPMNSCKHSARKHLCIAWSSLLIPCHVRDQHAWNVLHPHLPALMRIHAKTAHRLAYKAQQIHAITRCAHIVLMKDRGVRSCPSESNGHKAISQDRTDGTVMHAAYLPTAIAEAVICQKSSECRLYSANLSVQDKMKRQACDPSEKVNKGRSLRNRVYLVFASQRMKTGLRWCWLCIHQATVSYDRHAECSFKI